MFVPDDVRHVADGHSGILRQLAGERVVVETAVLYPNLGDPVQAERMEAAVATVTSTVAVGVPIVVMVDERCDTRVWPRLEDAGAICLPVLPSMAGLATPHIWATWIINQAAPDAAIIKVDAEKPLFGDDPEAGFRGSDFLGRLLHKLDIGDELVWVARDGDTLDTMTPVSERTESLLDLVYRWLIAALPSGDLPSGMFMMSPAAARVFVEYPVGKLGNTWLFLIWLPTELAKRGLSMSALFGHVRYQCSQELGNPEFTLKRLVQFLLMMAGGLQQALPDHYPAMSPERQVAADAEIAELTKLVGLAQKLGGVQALQRLTELVSSVGGLDELEVVVGTDGIPA